MKIEYIENYIDFKNDCKVINKNWRQFKKDGHLVIHYSDGTKETYYHKKGFLFDHASVPGIPFFRRWRFSTDLNEASYIHDILFIHRIGTVETSADIMNYVMEYCGVRSVKRWLIYKAVLSPFAYRIWNKNNERDFLNKFFCGVIKNDE